MSDNNIFGDTIVLLRKEKGLTQKELADKLGVTDKAVSRWETGKNYPDIEVLKKLADVLEVSVDDLLQGDIKLAEKLKPWRKTIVAVIVLVLLYVFPFYNWIAVTNTDFYGARESSYLLFRGLPSYHIKTSHIMKSAESAFSELGLTEDEAQEKYGALGMYCITTDYEDVVKEKHKLRLCSVMLDTYTSEHSGYMWVYYNQEGMTESGEVSTGSWKIYALWYLEKDENSNWYVADIKEGP